MALGDNDRSFFKDSSLRAELSDVECYATLLTFWVTHAGCLNEEMVAQYIRLDYGDVGTISIADDAGDGVARETNLVIEPGTKLHKYLTQCFESVPYAK